jgi:hypothetical protein
MPQDSMQKLWVQQAECVLANLSTLQLLIIKIHARPLFSHFDLNTGTDSQVL